MKRTLFGFGAVCISLLLISTVSAVPQIQSQPTMDMFDTLDQEKNLVDKLADLSEVLPGGLIDFIIQLITMIIQIVITLIDFVSELMGVIGLIQALIDSIYTLIDLVTQFIEMITDLFNPEPELFV